MVLITHSCATNAKLFFFYHYISWNNRNEDTHGFTGKKYINLKHLQTTKIEIQKISFFIILRAKTVYCC